MKTIFRYKIHAVAMTAFLALGAVAGMAQDPCEDTAGQTALSDKVRELFGKKDLESQKAKIDAGKQFLDKYGKCPPAKEFTDYLTPIIPKWEKAYADTLDSNAMSALTARFDAGLKAKNWDDVYASGKEILAKKPDDFRAAEIVLGSIGYDEAYKGNNKYNDDTLKYAKMSIADLEAGKTFKTFGVPPFSYKTKDDALGWLNLTVGYITQTDKKDKAGAAPYLYKASQAASDTAKNPIPYELIGFYYFDQLNTLVDEIQKLISEQNPKDPDDVAKQKVDAIKAKVAMSNGVAERAMDAFSRAYTLGQAPAYKTKMKNNVQEGYKRRFGKTDGVDAWIASAVAKPFTNPTTPITPISDPEPTTTTTTTGTAGVGAGTGNGVGTPTGTGTGKPTGTGMGTPTGTGTGKPATTTTTTTKTPTTTTTKTTTTSKPEATTKKPLPKKKSAK